MTSDHRTEKEELIRRWRHFQTIKFELEILMKHSHGTWTKYL